MEKLEPHYGSVGVRSPSPCPNPAVHAAYIASARSATLGFREDVGDMVAHRLGTQDDVGWGVSTGLALGHQGENFVFTIRQLWEELHGSTCCAWSSAREVVYQACCHGWAKNGLAVPDRAYGPQRLLLNDSFEQVTACPGTDGGKDRVLEHCHHQMADMGTGMQDAAGRPDLVDARQFDIGD